MSCGFVYFSVLTDPVELWSPKNSDSRRNKDYYDNNFRPFYRTTQLIVKPNNQSSWIYSIWGKADQVYGPALTKDFLHQVLDLQNQISSLIGTINQNNQTVLVSLSDICFQPLKPDNSNCTIQSILQYWQNNQTLLDKEINDEFGLKIYDYITHFENCVAAPTTLNDSLQIDCLAQFGGTIMPFIGLGGYPQPASPDPEYGNATALVITYVVNNHNSDTLNEPAMAWEKRVIEFLKNEYRNDNLTISFSTERSIQDELNRESQSDVKTVLISYTAMFLYITLTLGKLYSHNPSVYRKSIFSKCFHFFESAIINMKLSLGLIGVSIVIFAVTSSIGLFSYFGVKATLIIFEVIPFLVLAVGVDNIFILVQTYQREIKIPGESVEMCVSRVVSKVGPSILLTSISESIAFLLGALTPMPAVRIFSLYASLSVFLDFLLQITCFVSSMTLDSKRENSRRYDLLCCIKAQLDVNQIPQSFIENENNSEREIISPNNENHIHITDNSINNHFKTYESGFLHKIFKEYFANIVMHKYARPIVIIGFLFLFCTSFSLAPLVETGLDQKLSMPKDSYVLDYFEALEKYLSIGVPVYFVIKSGLNYSSPQVQNLICSTSGCNSDSMLNQISQAALQPNFTHIGFPANSWLDDYFDWLASGDCCRVFANDTSLFCPSSSNGANCVPCPISYLNDTNRPTSTDFEKYLVFYLKDNPNTKCAKGGHAAYGESLQIYYNNTELSIGATFFMAYHTTGVTSNDFINSLRNANDISKNITNMLRNNILLSQNMTSEQVNKIEVFAYSVFYVYYEQYLTIWKDGLINLTVSIIAIYIITTILLGLDFHSSTLVTITLLMMTIDLFGCMYIFNIQLNAISLVNIVMVRYLNL